MMQRASNATPIHCQRGDDSMVIATASPMLKCLFRLETASLHKRVGLVTREVIVDPATVAHAVSAPAASIPMTIVKISFLPKLSIA